MELPDQWLFDFFMFVTQVYGVFNCCHVLEGNQEQWEYHVMFVGVMGSHWPEILIFLLLVLGTFGSVWYQVGILFVSHYRVVPFKLFLYVYLRVLGCFYCGLPNKYDILKDV